MEKVQVALGARSYDILIADGLLDRAAEHLAPFARNNRLLVISDEDVWAAQGERLTQGLGGIEAVPILVAPGEGAKSFAVLESVVDRLLSHGVERKDHIVAFGGGVIGDLAGFAASIVNRGCPFVQVPTTLLSQVDSSVGGKTAINVSAGKNLVGAFHQPSLVLIDPACLWTLPVRQIRSGYAEIAKYALIEDAEFFEWLEANVRRIMSRDPEACRQAIARSVAGKARIVEEDERETSGRRALLNLGHTFGHALEAEKGFSDRLLHGEAVAAGTVLAFDFSAQQGFCTQEDADRVRSHFDAAGVSTSLEDLEIWATGARLVAHMQTDKKKEGGNLPFILARGIGEAYLDKNVALGDIEAFLENRR